MAYDSSGGVGFVVSPANISATGNFQNQGSIGYDNFNPQREVVPVVEIHEADCEKVR